MRASYQSPVSINSVVTSQVERLLSCDRMQSGNIIDIYSVQNKFQSVVRHTMRQAEGKQQTCAATCCDLLLTKKKTLGFSAGARSLAKLLQMAPTRRPLGSFWHLPA